MVTFRCCLRFPDGAEVSATLGAGTPLDDAAIFYEGPLERLPVAPVTASAIELKAYFQSFGRELNARYSERLDQEPPTLADEPAAAADS